VVAPGGANNTAAGGGYDAGFGPCSVHRETGDVIHRLQGAPTPDDVGMEAARTLTVKNDRLQASLTTMSWESKAVNRTLTWERIGWLQGGRFRAHRPGRQGGRATAAKSHRSAGWWNERRELAPLAALLAASASLAGLLARRLALAFGWALLLGPAVFLCLARGPALRSCLRLAAGALAR